jgi:tetratricopeptide (TPR) repeat protein
MIRLTRLTLAVLLTASSAPGVAAASNAQASSPQSLFEAGKFQEAAQAASGDGSEPGRWLRAHALVRANQAGQAREVLGSLASGDENSPWRLVAESTMAQIDGNLDAAQSLAERAVSAAPDMFEAQYQLGLVRSARGDFEAAADALQRAADLNGGFAYAHYYAGLAYSKAKRMDRAGAHFDAFVRQAPAAPETPAVQAILRTLKGR